MHKEIIYETIINEIKDYTRTVDQIINCDEVSKLLMIKFEKQRTERKTSHLAK